MIFEEIFKSLQTCSKKFQRQAEEHLHSIPFVLLLLYSVLSTSQNTVLVPSTKLLV